MYHDIPQWVVIVLAWIGSVVTAVGTIYLTYRKTMRAGMQAKADTSSLELVGAAISHWKGLHDEAWEQVKKERKLRSEAEERLTRALGEIEKLRGEVAELRRDIANLSALSTKGNPNGSHQ